MPTNEQAFSGLYSMYGLQLTIPGAKLRFKDTRQSSVPTQQLIDNPLGPRENCQARSGSGPCPIICGPWAPCGRDRVRPANEEAPLAALRAEHGARRNPLCPPRAVRSSAHAAGSAGCPPHVSCINTAAVARRPKHPAMPLATRKAALRRRGLESALAGLLPVSPELKIVQPSSALPGRQAALWWRGSVATLHPTNYLHIATLSISIVLLGSVVIASSPCSSCFDAVL
eukprot:scaffold3970_cov417-Prasinococcus_capsulatus_cf.AAC.4